MTKSTTTVGVTTLRKKTTAVFRALDREGQLFVFHRAKPAAVLLTAKKYAEMSRVLEDLLDIEAIEESLKEPRIPLSSYIKKRWGKL